MYLMCPGSPSLLLHLLVLMGQRFFFFLLACGFIFLSWRFFQVSLWVIGVLLVLAIGLRLGSLRGEKGFLKLDLNGMGDPRTASRFSSEQVIEKNWQATH